MSRIYKFVDWELKSGPNLNYNYENVKKEFEKQTQGGNQFLLNGYMKLMGYIYDFRSELRKFIVKQYGQWNEYYAPNKTLLRKNIYWRIEKIVELKN